MGEWEDYPAAFGARFKEFRTANNLTLRQLEGITRISSTALSRVEKGYEFPSSGLLHALAKYEECDIDELIIGRKLENGEYLYFANTFEQESISHDLVKVTAIYMVRLKQMNLATGRIKHDTIEKHREYEFVLKLAECICEKYDNNAEEGQVFKSIRTTLDRNMREMSEILDIDSTRYRYVEKHGGARVTELVKLYDKLKINPAFVLSGQCERLIMCV